MVRYPRPTRAHGQGAKIAQQVSANGLFEIPSGTSTKATHSVAYRGGTSRSYVRWRAVTGGAPAAIAPGKPHTVEISSRLRLSLWAFTPPLTKETPGEIDNAQVQLLKDADVDDLSLVWTATWDTRRKPSDPPKPPIWDPHFVVRGSSDEKIRVTYLKNLIAALHPKVQVIAGYELVRATPDPKKPPPKNDATMRDRVTDFAAWLLKATPDDIKKYAQSIREFFKSRGLDVDGVGYDFEFDQLTKAHRANLERLYVETSNAFADRNGLVSYANAPFKEDGAHSFGFMQAQPYAIAAQGRNLLARPMCFDAVTSTSVADIEASIACALRAAARQRRRGPAPVAGAVRHLGRQGARRRGRVVPPHPAPEPHRPDGLQPATNRSRREHHAEELQDVERDAQSQRRSRRTGGAAAAGAARGQRLAAARNHLTPRGLTARSH